MTGHMFIDNQRVEFHTCDSPDHADVRFATVQLGWTPSIHADYCDECAHVWLVYAAELGGQVVSQRLPDPQEAIQDIRKRVVA